VKAGVARICSPQTERMIAEKYYKIKGIRHRLGQNALFERTA
jgi:hypothetical protein